MLSKLAKVSPPVVLILTTVSGCTSSPSLAEAALRGGTFTVNEVLGGAVDKAYAFCKYTSKEAGESLGLNPDEFFGVNDNPQKWETYTGIGVSYKDGREPHVEWFDPRSVDACPGTTQPGDEIDPNAPIRVEKQTVEFVRGGSDEVAVLNYS